MGRITHSGSSGLFIEEYAPARRLASEPHGSGSHQEDQMENALEAQKVSMYEDGARTEEEQWLAQPLREVEEAKPGPVYQEITDRSTA
jgi:hypothetical protein